MKRFPWIPLALLLALVAAGLLLVGSAGGEAAFDSPALRRQLLFAAAGLAAFAVAARIRPGRLYDLSYFLYGGSLLLLLAVFLVGHRSRAVARWIPLPLGFKLQPSEFAKLALALALARSIADLGRVDRLSRWWGPALLALVPAGVVLVQPDLGTALLVLPLPAALLFVAGARVRHFVLVGALAAGAAALAWESGLVRPYQKDRVLSFLDPGRDPDGAGYQAMMSVVTIGCGGLWGRRPPSMTRLGYVPERHTDFIFSVAGEAGGFAGSALLLLLYLALLSAFLAMAARTPEPFARLVIAGIAIPFGLQVLVNVAMSLQLAPVTGVTLPFASYGGSSLVTSLLGAGIAFGTYRRGHLPATPAPAG